MGGHQGRPLIAGDSVPIGAELNDTAAAGVTCEGATMAGQHWTVGCVVGPHGAPDFLTVGGMKAFFEAAWRVHHNSNRNGVRLLGPKPEWTRTDGGAGGSHPSNVIDNEYAVGTINFTGDMPSKLLPCSLALLTCSLAHLLTCSLAHLLTCSLADVLADSRTG